MTKDIRKKIGKIEEEMLSIFDDFFHLEMPFNVIGEGVFTPLVDVYQTETEIIIKVEIAGVRENDFFISLNEDFVLIRGFRRVEEPVSGEKRYYHKMEIHVGPFKRHIRLPAPVNSDVMKSSYRNGILEVRLLKKKVKKVQPVEIKIE